MAPGAAIIIACRDLLFRSKVETTLRHMGMVPRTLGAAGDLGAAREHHLQAVRLARQINSQWDEAHAWAGLGRCDLAAGQVEAAVGHLSTALAIFRRIGAVEAAGVAAEIDAIEP